MSADQHDPAGGSAVLRLGRGCGARGPLVPRYRRSGKTRVLSLKGVGKIDLSGADFLIREMRRARRYGRDMHVIAANPSVLDALRRLGCVEELGEGNIHDHKGDAISAAVSAAEDGICARCRLRVFAECSPKPGPKAAE